MSKLKLMLSQMDEVIAANAALDNSNPPVSKDKYSGFEVRVLAPGAPKAEIIYNPHENIAMKRDYYSKAYNDDLKLINNTNIRIVSFIKCFRKEE